MCLSFPANLVISRFLRPLALHVTVTRDASVMDFGPSPDPRNAIRILLVDDNAVFRAGVRALLGKQRDLVVVGEVGTGEEAVTCAKATRPDVVLMDLAMPGKGGLWAMRQLTALGELAHRPETSLAGHGQVHQHDVRSGRFGAGHGFFSGPDLADHDEIPLLPQ